jgi:hypothetical protein
MKQHEKETTVIAYMELTEPTSAYRALRRNWRVRMRNVVQDRKSAQKRYLGLHLTQKKTETYTL